MPEADGRGVADDVARYYDLDLAEEASDIDMYLAFAEACNGRVLELMAGSGRVAVPLAEAGHHVTAVDRDPSMLARAAARWQSARPNRSGGPPTGGALELIEADVAQLSLGRRFDLVVVALNSILLIDRRDVPRVFAAIAAHLAPGGRAVLDVWLPAPEDLVLYDGRLVLDWVRDDQETGETVSKSTAARFHSASRTAEVTSLFDAWRDGGPARRTMRQDTICFASADELEALAAGAGMTVDTLAGDYEMGHFDADSERLVMVCRSGVR